MQERFLEDLSEKILARLARGLQDCPALGVNGDALLTVRNRRANLRSFSIVHDITASNGEQAGLRLIAKTRKARGIRDYQEAVFNERSATQLKQEWDFLREVHEVFSSEQEIGVPQPLFFFPELNTIVVTRARGIDFSDYTDSFKKKVHLAGTEQQRIEGVTRLIARWLDFYHSHFQLEEQEVETGTLIEEVIFHGDYKTHLEHIPPAEIKRFKDAVGDLVPQPSFAIPCANLHGDYKYRHIWHDNGAYLTVIDFGNQMRTNFIYEDIAGFVTETIFLDFGVTLHKLNGLPRLIERSFLDHYPRQLDPVLLRLFIIKYLIKKWHRRKLRLGRFVARRGRSPLIRLAETATDRYINRYFANKIEQQIALLHRAVEC